MTKHHVAPVGFLRGGSPVWPIAGGAGETVEEPPVEEPPADAPPADPPVEDPPKPSPLEQQAQEAIDELKQAGQEVPQALEKAVKEFRDARREAASYRTQSREQQTQQAEAMKSLAKAFGIDVGDDKPPDPAELQTQIEQSQRDAQQARVELAAYKAAGKHDADADALLDSRSFLAKVAKVDPAADDFDEQIDAAVRDSIESNPKLKASPGGGSQSRGPAQGPRSQPPQRAATLEEAVNRRLNQPA